MFHYNLNNTKFEWIDGALAIGPASDTSIHISDNKIEANFKIFLEFRLHIVWLSSVIMFDYSEACNKQQWATMIELGIYINLSAENNNNSKQKIGINFSL